MKEQVSRRMFLTRSAMALGAVAVWDLGSIGRAEQTGVSAAPVSGDLKERTMPHVIVKMYPGRSEQQKTQLTGEIVKDVTSILKCGEESVSVAIEEVSPQDWAEKVYKTDILKNLDKLYKKPGYSL